MRLVPRTRDEGLDARWVAPARLRDAAPNGCGCGRRVGVDGERPPDARRRGLERKQDVLALDGDGLGGDAGVDARVAVAVATDPASEPHKWRDLAFRAERILEGPHELRHEAKQGVVEDRHQRADLVDGPDLEGPQLRRPPQRIDLLDQPPVRIEPLAVRDPRIIKALELIAHTPDRRHHGTPSGLCRVGGEDGVDLETSDELVQPLRPEPAAELMNRRADRLGHRLRSAVAFANHARSVVLLGQVGEMEVAGEGSCDELRKFQRPRGDELLCLAFVAVVVAGADHQRAQPLDVMQQTLAS